MPAMENKASATITIACPPDLFLRFIVPQYWTASAELAPRIPLAKLTGDAPGQSIAIADTKGVLITISTLQARGALQEGGGKVFAVLQALVVALSEHGEPGVSTLEVGEEVVNV